ncbi:hypothetical protein QJS66_13805 [Kocuria rhizophila]|nr:hypothetical protein QJS66_13805 [Kocuria rhizophila]
MKRLAAPASVELIPSSASTEEDHVRLARRPELRQAVLNLRRVLAIELLSATRARSPRAPRNRARRRRRYRGPGRPRGRARRGPLDGALEIEAAEGVRGLGTLVRTVESAVVLLN